MKNGILCERFKDFDQFKVFFFIFLNLYNIKAECGHFWYKECHALNISRKLWHDYCVANYVYFV